ncbi:MAG TPA: glycosyltransferase [Candidatus Obscuribacterales bacterium]
MRIAFLSRIKRRFNGETVRNEPLGGTQSAIIYLARALAERGHEAHIFCHCEELAGCIDGVHYRNIAELARFARQQPLDVFVAVADETALKLGIPARITLWWSHNDYSYLWDEMPDLRAEFAGILATRADRLVAVSDWHARKLAELFKLPPEHIWIGRNGVHWPYFEAEPEPAAPPRLLYTSVPDRGLERLLQHFEAIRAQVPAAELHLYSSFRVWGKDADWDQERAGALYSRAQAMEQVFLHEPLPHPELARALSQGYLLAYPSQAAEPVHTTGFWAETSCIAALEAQAAGLPVITSARGALPETILDGETGILIAGDPHSDTYAAAFTDACVRLLRQPEERDRLGAAARRRIQQELRWDLIAAQWEALLGPDFVSTRQQSSPMVSPFPSPKISLIIPTYNRARNLKNCLESLTWQDEKAFEVIVCDDGSSDKTREVALSYTDRLNLRYRWQEDLGFRAGEARNLGLQAARGKLIVFLDSDLVVPPDFVRAHAEAHARHGKSRIVVNSFVWRMLESDDADLGLPPSEYIPRHKDILKPDSRTRYEIFERNEPVEETYFLDSNALSIKREDLALVGAFDPEFIGWGHEDTELGYRIARFGFKLAFIRAEAYHQFHSVSETKEDERAVNWKRLTVKHGISNWYHPLWELPVESMVLCLDEGLPPLLEAQWLLKTGHRAPVGGLYYRLTLEAGILKAIDPLGEGKVSE